MFTKIEELSPNTFALYDAAAETSKFLRGQFAFDPSARQLTIGSVNPSVINVPADIDFAEGIPVQFRLHDEASGLPKKQVRDVVFAPVKDGNGVLRAKGLPKTPAKFKPADGWLLHVFKFRAYASHPGVVTDTERPEWLRAWIENSRHAWNAAAATCRNRRRECFAEVQDSMRAFRDEMVTRIEAFNASLGRSKDTAPFPSGINKQFLSLAPFVRYSARLRHMMREERPVPPGLLEDLDAFVKALKPQIDYAPINTFQKEFGTEFDAAVTGLSLHPLQHKLVKESVGRVLKARKGKKQNFDKGWPAIRYQEDDGAFDWGIQKHIDSANIEASKIFTTGVGGLRLGPPLPLADTGHPGVDPNGSRAKRRTLHQAIITVPKTGETYTFCVLKSRDIPAKDFFLKQWSLGEKNNKMWLCLTACSRFPVAVADSDSPAAALELGWRTLPDGNIRVGTFVLPEPHAAQAITINLGKSYGRTDAPVQFDDKTAQNRLYNQREPFHANLGPTFLTRRALKRGSADAGEATSLAIQAFAEALSTGIVTVNKAASQVLQFLALSRAYIFIDTFGGILQMQTRRSLLTEMTRSFVALALGSQSPSWISQAHARGLIKLSNELAGNEEIRSILQQWGQVDALFGSKYSYLWSKVVARRNKEYERIAHAMMRQMLEHGVGRLHISGRFLRSVIETTDKYSDPALRNSQRYRQWVGLTSLETILKHTAVKYGIAVSSVTPAMKTRICNQCGTENEVGSAKDFHCGGCSTVLDLDGVPIPVSYDQDENAGKNLRDGSHLNAARAMTTRRP